LDGFKCRKSRFLITNSYQSAGQQHDAHKLRSIALSYRWEHGALLLSPVCLSLAASFVLPFSLTCFDFCSLISLAILVTEFVTHWLIRRSFTHLEFLISLYYWMIILLLQFRSWVVQLNKRTPLCLESAKLFPSVLQLKSLANLLVVRELQAIMVIPSVIVINNVMPST